MGNKLVDVQSATFWDHLDELKSVLVRIIIGVLVAGIGAFFFKDEVFSVILAPKDSDFVTYKLLGSFSSLFSSSSQTIESFSINLINTQLAQQFMIHVRMSMYVGLLLVFPYVLYQLFSFVAPALYDNEQRYSFRVISCGYVMFLMGVALSYYLVFPLTLRFLGSYQVSVEVTNMISLESYISTMMMLSIMMGVVFEIPILCWLFAKLGLLTDTFMRKYRRHAIVALLIVSAIVTPTADAMTLFVVAMPMYLLYEVSILIVASTKKVETEQTEEVDEPESIE
ncbi:MAG: twin-arginine translocase subunit TatC [Rikenellaceae bacterium]